MEDQIFIQHRFTITNPETGYSFSDAIVLPEAEYQALTPTDIEQLKQERFDNWQTTINTPSEEVVVPIDEQVTAIDQQIADLIQQKDILVASDPVLTEQIDVVQGGE